MASTMIMMVRSSHATNVDTEKEHSLLQQSSPDQSKIPLGYICAVSGATLSFFVLLGLKASAEGAASSVPFPDRIWHFMMPLIAMGALFWIFAFLIAMLPFAATYAVARRLKIRSISYYVVCGAITGAILTPVFVFLGPQMSWQNEQNFLQDCVSWGPILGFSGACGAVAFWHTTGRHIGHTRPEALSPQN